MNRGEVWWIESPRSGRRPHLILTRQAALPLLSQILAVPATRTVRGIPTEVPLDEDDGMPSSCALSLDNLALVPTSYFIDRICRLRGDRMIQVCTALGVATGCRG